MKKETILYIICGCLTVALISVIIANYTKNSDKQENPVEEVVEAVAEEAEVKEIVNPQDNLPTLSLQDYYTETKLCYSKGSVSRSCYLDIPCEMDTKMAIRNLKDAISVYTYDEINISVSKTGCYARVCERYNAQNCGESKYTYIIQISENRLTIRGYFWSVDWRFWNVYCADDALEVGMVESEFGGEVLYLARDILKDNYNAW